jgi:diguanylate cyclase (GGDEF)-like protein
MAIDIQTFASPFARRLFILLFLSVTLPVMVLAAITIVQVTDHLLGQYRQLLQRDAKHIGMSLFARIEQVATELPLHAANETRLGTVGIRAQPRWLDGRQPGAPAWLYRGVPDPALDERAARTEPPQALRAVSVRTLETAAGPAFFVFYRAAADDLFMARLHPEYLWEPDLLPQDKTVCLIEGDRRVLFCSEPQPDRLLAAFARARAQSTSGQFGWQADGEPMFAVYWGVFLGNLGMDTEWSVLLGEPEQHFFAPIERFQNSLTIVVLVSMLAAMMVGIGQIRRVLRPLQTLRAATRLVGDGDLNKPVVLRSGDEFEELADAFNGMTGKLAWQFQQLEALAGIDRLILSSMDAPSVISQVADHVQAFLGCELLLLCVEQDGQPQLQLSVLDEAQSGTVSPLDAATYRQALSLIANQADAVQAQPPAWLLHAPPGPSMASWTSILLLTEGRPEGLVVVGSSRPVAQARTLLPSALQALDRISIVLTRARWQAQLHQQAYYDDLTGLANRAALKKELSQTLERSRHAGTRLAVLFLDLDRFKLINDSIGHGAGDRYLQVIAGRIQACVRSSGMVARLGGDEFTIALADHRERSELTAEVMAVVNDLLASIPQPVRIGPHELRSTLSIGIAVFPDDGQTLDDLMKQADTAMYKSKQRGGNGYHFYDQTMHQAAQERMELESEMRHALEHDEFELHFQPQVAAADGQMIGAEALLRWRHPLRGMVSPGVFIPIAEESMLIADIDCWVLHATCRQIRRWLDAGLQSVRVAINISAAQFQQQHFLQRVENTLASFNIGTERIELEITEGALIHDLPHALDTLRQLSDAGICLAIDDFGTGYSSLGYLKSMPIDKLKIDRSFVHDLLRSPRDAAIVEVILQLARQLGLSCIAEGVETTQQRDWLQARGCEAFQGFLFHRPMPVDSFNALLAQHTLPQVLV